MSEEHAHQRRSKLNSSQFNEWCDRLGLSSQARSHIENVRSSPPARRVASRGNSFIGRYPSQKMGCTIQYESRTVELGIIYTLEHDPDVLEYYDQPPEIKLSYRHSSGRRIAFHTVEDFFVLRHASGEYVQGKPELTLIEKSQEMPNRFCRDDKGRWRCPPGEEYAAQFGLNYRVISSADLEPIWQQNIEYLEDYFAANVATVASKITTRVLAVVTARPGIVLEELRQVTTDHASVDEINSLIATGRIYVNLREARLTDPANVRLFVNATVAAAFPLVSQSVENTTSETTCFIEERPGTCVEWDGRPLRIVHVGLTGVVLEDESHALVELTLEHWNSLLQRGQIKSLTAPPQQNNSEALHKELLQSSETRLEDANRRALAIAALPSNEARQGGQTGNDGEGTHTCNAGKKAASARSVRRWKKKSREANISHGNGFIGLLDHKHKRGNRKKKLAEKVRQSMQEIIASDYENIINRRRVHVHAKLILECENLGLVAPSFKTFCLAVKARSGPAQTKEREGDRAAYQADNFVYWLEADTPRHGERPFEIGYLDHYEFPIELVSPRTGNVLGKAWGSIMTDGSTRRTLAAYISFEEPSYRSCLMALRLCVRNYGRLPKVLVVDHGPEFESVYFQTICALFGIELRYRPAGQPRGGSVIERHFRTTETRFVHGLLGNTQLSQNGRQLTKAVSAKENAVWTLARFAGRAWEFLHEHQDNIVHPALGESPRAAFQRGLMLHGQRNHTRLAYDAAFKLMTMPGTKRRTATIHPQKGVRVNYFDYWSPVFSAPRLAKTKVRVRFDPWNLSVAYAEVNKCWVECHSNHNRLLHGRTEKELIHATSELRKQAFLQGRQAKITALRLARFMAETHDEQTDLLREKAFFNEEIINLGEKTKVSSQSTEASGETSAPAEASPENPQPPPSPAESPWDVPVDRDGLDSLPRSDYRWKPLCSKRQKVFRANCSIQRLRRVRTTSKITSPATII